MSYIYPRFVNESVPEIYEVFVNPFGTRFNRNDNGYYMNKKIFVYGFGLYTTNIVTRLLPPPYKSKCMNYGDAGYENRQDILNQCYLKKSTIKFESICWGAQVNLSSELFIKYFEHTAGFEEIIEDCNQIHDRPDCDDEFFTMSYIGHSPEAENEISFTPDKFYLVQEHPLISLIDYLIYVASIFLLWLGIDFNIKNSVLVYKSDIQVEK